MLPIALSCVLATAAVANDAVWFRPDLPTWPLTAETLRTHKSLHVDLIHSVSDYVHEDADEFLPAERGEWEPAVIEPALQGTWVVVEAVRGRQDVSEEHKSTKWTIHRTWVEVHEEQPIRGNGYVEWTMLRRIFWQQYRPGGSLLRSKATGQLGWSHVIWTGLHLSNGKTGLHLSHGVGDASTQVVMTCTSGQIVAWMREEERSPDDAWMVARTRLTLRRLP